jgi:hypothetical protein
MNPFTAGDGIYAEPGHEARQFGRPGNALAVNGDVA